MQDLLPRDAGSGLEVGADGAGQVRRERNPHDRRSYAVTITDSGRQRLAAAQSSIPAFLEDTFHALTDDERGQLSTILAKLL
ncbi:MarR family winged helix-turn-helix transcriptional regulator [Nonomuraea sp. B19D2]|uniref:MarR family winged helix-turn-helix transcriptional regulator n=1 Tax=Nonomuraea sp. B19D2 TaxID=3159561 RepID=UPI0032DB7413